MLSYLFVINGNDVTSYIKSGTSIKVTRSLGESNVARVYVDEEVFNTYTITPGDSVVISRGETTTTDQYVFRGKVIKTETVGLDHVLVCRDPIEELKNSYLTKSFDKNIDTEAGVVSAIFETIATGAGVTVNVEDSSALPTLNKFICYDNSRLERLTALANFLGWTYYYDYENDYLKFAPKGFTSFTTTLQNDINLYNNPIWTEDIDTMRNSIKIRGAYDEDTRIEFKTGDTIETEFTVTNTPIITEVEHPVGTLLTRGVPGSTTTYDYYVEEDLKKIIFLTPPGSGASDIKIKYTTRIPRPVQGVNQTSIDKYGVTNEDVFTFNDILSLDDAENRLASLLEILGVANITTTLQTNVYGVSPNDVVSVVDTRKPQYSGDYIVHSLTIDYPTQRDLLEIGPVDFTVSGIISNISLRIKLLEQGQAPQEDILRQVKTLNRTIAYERRETKQEIRNVAGDTGIYGHPVYGLYGTAKYGETSSSSFILGNPTFGVLGTNKLGSSSTATLTTIALIPGKNTFKEYVYDNNYYDSVNSVNVTWDTTDQDITITDTLYTEMIALGTSYTYYTVSLASATGTSDYTIEISGDGKSTWETVTEDTQTTFTTSDGTGIYLRVTNNSGSGWPTAFGTWGTASTDLVIANTYKTGGDYNLPAIKVILEE